jgi:regulator of sigma E protease
MGFFYSVIGFLLAIGILVTVHEYGHYWMARRLGVKVLRFSVGFGKPLWKRVAGPDQTEYVLAAIPLGGYVKMLGENDPETPIAENERHRAFDNQPVWKRSLIVAAGPGINFLFAITLFMVLGMQDSQRLVPVLGSVAESSPLGAAGVESGARLLSIDGKPYRYYNEHDVYILNKVLTRDPINLTVQSSSGVADISIPTSDIPIYKISPAGLMRQLGFSPLSGPPIREVGAVSAGYPAHEVGILPGDKFVSINGEAIADWSDLVRIVQPSHGQILNVVMDRNGEQVQFAVTPKTEEAEGQKFGVLGVGARPKPRPESQFVTISQSPLQAIVSGAEETWLMSVTMVRMIGKMVTLQVSPRNVNGPLMIADVAGQVIQINWQSYVFFLALISISLGVMNLLPVPMLDGGHLLRFAIEVVAGRQISDKVYLALQPLGLLMLAGLMSLAFYNDISAIFN